MRAKINLKIITSISFDVLYMPNRWILDVEWTKSAVWIILTNIRRGKWREVLAGDKNFVEFSKFLAVENSVYTQ